MLALRMTALGSTFSSFSRHPFVRNVMAVAGGTAAAQAITMAFAPIITRLYGPEAFGVQGTFLSLVSIVTPLSALAYPIAIVLPRSDADAQALKWLSMLVACAVATIVLLGLLLAFDVAAGILGDQSVAPFLWLLPIVVILAAWQQVTQQWLIRKETFKSLARIAVIQAFVVNSARAGLGLMSATATMLVAVTTLGFGLHGAMQWWAGRRCPPDEIPQEKAKALREQAKQHRDFPLFRAPEMILSAISESLPVLVLAAAFGPAEAGFYALARSIVHLPLDLIGQSVANVFYPKFNAYALAGRPLLPLLFKALGILSAIGLPAFVLIAAISPWLFSLVFGAEWQRAGVYASLLSIWLFVKFTNRPCIGATSVLSMQRLFLFQGIIALVIRAVALWIGGYLLADDLWTVGLFGVASAFAAAFLIALVAWRARN